MSNRLWLMKYNQFFKLIILVDVVCKRLQSQADYISNIQYNQPQILDIDKKIQEIYLTPVK